MTGGKVKKRPYNALYNFLMAPTLAEEKEGGGGQNILINFKCASGVDVHWSFTSQEVYDTVLTAYPVRFKYILQLTKHFLNRTRCRGRARMRMPSRRSTMRARGCESQCHDVRAREHVGSWFDLMGRHILRILFTFVSFYALISAQFCAFSVRV